MVRAGVTAGLVFLGVTLTLFCAPSYAVYTATIGSGVTELGMLVAFVFYSPLIGLFLVLSVSAGLVASHIAYRRLAHPSGA
jgi:uncharacterized membrane protein